MWSAAWKEADEDCGGIGGLGEVPPLVRCHIPEEQTDGGVPLRGQPDLPLLGPHGSPLLRRRVGSAAIPEAGAEKQNNPTHDVDFVFQTPEPKAALLRRSGEKLAESDGLSGGANLQGGGDLYPRGVQQQSGKLQQ